MEIIPFDPAHLADIRPLVVEPDVLEAFSASYVQRGVAFTAFDGGRVLGCAGVVLRGSTGYVWAALTDEIRKRPMFLHRAIRRGMSETIKAYGLKRLEAACDIDHRTAARWLERLGFTLAGTTERHGTTDMRFVYDVPR